jgi:hypothetical protein
MPLNIARHRAHHRLHLGQHTSSPVLSAGPVLEQILSILLPILTLIGLAFPGFVIKPLITQKQPAILSALSFFDTILLTLGAVLLRSKSLTCELEQRWRTLFQNHDANTIRGIQDRLECCGLRSVLDQPWPFPDNHGATRCRDNFGRDRNCGPLWRAREVEVLSIWVSVAVLGLVVKVYQGFPMLVLNLILKRPVHSFCLPYFVFCPPPK